MDSLMLYTQLSALFGLSSLIIASPFILYLLFKLVTTFKPRLEVINGRRSFEFGQYQARKRFSLDARNIIQNGLRKVPCDFPA